MKKKKKIQLIYEKEKQPSQRISWQNNQNQANQYQTYLNVFGKYQTKSQEWPIPLSLTT